MDWFSHFLAGMAISLSVSFGTGEPKYGLYAGYAAWTAERIYVASKWDEKASLATFAGAIAGYGAYKVFEKR